MAGPFDFFSQGQWSDPNQPGIADQFNQFLSDPRGRAALLQSGLSLMGGRAWGDNPTSQIARAIGAGGEAVRSEEEQQQTAQENKSKQALRAAQAADVTSRGTERERANDIREQALGLKAQQIEATTQRYKAASELAQRKWEGQLAIANQKLAMAKTDLERKQARDDVDRIRKEAQTEQDKLLTEHRQRMYELGLEKEAGVQQRSTISSGIRASEAYRKEMADIDRQNKAGALTDPNFKPIPKPSFQDWKQQRGIRTQGGEDTTTAPQATQPAVAPSESTASGQPKYKKFNQGWGVWDPSKKNYVPFNGTPPGASEGDEEAD